MLCRRRTITVVLLSMSRYSLDGVAVSLFFCCFFLFSRMLEVLRVYPLETRHCTRPVCPSCSNVLPGDVTDFSNLKACATCGADLDSRSLQFKYWVALDIKDGAVTLPVLICGGDADLFFRSFPACDLWTNPVTHQLLSQKLDLLCNGGDMVTLAIQSYVPVTGDAKKKRIYQVFNTVLE